MNGETADTDTGDAAQQPSSLHALEQQFVPDTIDDDEEELTSFAYLKNKTMIDLYGVGGNDRSPKGSVDVAIRPLVDLINVHPSFATLSSCSGRIALFDPQAKEENSNDNIENKSEEREDSGDVEKSGKGHGMWLLASHEDVEPSALIDVLDEGGEAREMLIFKYEPLLLHVAASSLRRGRQLLSLGLGLGFRESGLVVSQHRVTVAIRGHSLALCVPLARRGPLRPSCAYLETLVKEANTRMHSNREKLQRLYESVQETLFRPKVQQKVLSATVSKLPPLKLWGHAAVAVPMGSDDDIDVLVFGGYGEGPDLHASAQNGKGKRCCRSKSVYCLRRRGTKFDDQWRKIEQATIPANDRITPFSSTIGVEVLPVDFSPREGLAACVLPTKSPSKELVVAIYGGRASPGMPFGDLLLYEPCSTHQVFMKPWDVRGEGPEARWGHSFTALSGEGGLMAVLVGGRNEKTVFEPLHILTLIADENGMGHFQWTKVDLGLPARFSHTSVVIDGSIFVFGGLSDTNDLLEAFSDSYRYFESRATSQPGISAFDVNSDGVAILKDGDEGDESIEYMARNIGGASCVLKVPGASGANHTLVALTGGVSCNQSQHDPIQWCEIKNCHGDNVALVPRNDIQMDSVGAVDFGSMVHHCCVTLPSPPNVADFVLVGGGASSFAFGPSFARSHHVQLGLKPATKENRKSSPRSKKSSRTNVKLPPNIDKKPEKATDVLYVTARDAKTLKTALERAGYLDKKFRMAKAESGPSLENGGWHIAVPVIPECLAMLENNSDDQPEWASLVVAKGQQQVPFSSAVLGQQRK